VKEAKLLLSVGVNAEEISIGTTPSSKKTFDEYIQPGRM
jgi:hypothetical protein